jgi:hypothetical protein
MNDLIAQATQTLSERVQAIQDPVPEFSMRRFVVGQHDTPGQQWAQAVLELDNRIMAIATADVDIKIAHKKIEALEQRGTEIALLKADKIRLELKVVERARLGTLRGVGHLLKIITELEAAHGGHGWTRAELDAELPEYWKLRAQRQAIHDLNFHGRVGVGNQDMLWMMGRPINPPQQHVAAVERRFLECGKVKMLIAVPTLIDRETVMASGLRCLEGWTVPDTIERRIYVVQGKPVADAYNDAATTALEDAADFLLCVEDDHVIPPGTFDKLWAIYQDHGPRAIVGAWYPQKKDQRSGAPIVIRDGKRTYLDDDGDLHEVYAIPQGFALIPTQVFREIPQPWFVTTGCVTQDSYFSQQARDAGWRLYVDSSTRIKHVCRNTGKVYE